MPSSLESLLNVPVLSSFPHLSLDLGLLAELFGAEQLMEVIERRPEADWLALEERREHVLFTLSAWPNASLTQVWLHAHFAEAAL